MIKIVLICSAWISDNRILDKINDFIVKNNYDMQFFVITPEQLDNNYNIILLATQVEYLSTKVVTIAKNSKVAVLPSELYINNDFKGIIDFVNML